MGWGVDTLASAPVVLGALLLKLGDGSRVKTASCDVGDKLISGGAGSVDAASKVLDDDFPINTYQWQARILPHAGGDNWTVVILCLAASAWNIDVGGACRP
jgi:hypothetical protein